MGCAGLRGGPEGTKPLRAPDTSAAVESFEIAEDLSVLNPAWSKGNGFNFAYRLGPPMHPPSEVRTGNIFRNGRVYCAIDTLLSGAFKTIGEARDETKRRLNEPLDASGHKWKRVRRDRRPLKQDGALRYANPRYRPHSVTGYAHIMPSSSCASAHFSAASFAANGLSRSESPSSCGFT